MDKGIDLLDEKFIFPSLINYFGLKISRAITDIHCFRSVNWRIGYIEKFFFPYLTLIQC